MSTHWPGPDTSWPHCPTDRMWHLSVTPMTRHAGSSSGHPHGTGRGLWWWEHSNTPDSLGWEGEAEKIKVYIRTITECMFRGVKMVVSSKQANMSFLKGNIYTCKHNRGHFLTQHAYSTLITTVRSIANTSLASCISGLAAVIHVSYPFPLSV